MALPPGFLDQMIAQLGQNPNLGTFGVPPGIQTGLRGLLPGWTGQIDPSQLGPILNQFQAAQAQTAGAGGGGLPIIGPGGQVIQPGQTPTPGGGAGGGPPWSNNPGGGAGGGPPWSNNRPVQPPSPFSNMPPILPTGQPVQYGPGGRPILPGQPGYNQPPVRTGPPRPGSPGGPPLPGHGPGPSTPPPNPTNKVPGGPPPGPPRPPMTSETGGNVVGLDPSGSAGNPLGYQNTPTMGGGYAGPPELARPGGPAESPEDLARALGQASPGGLSGLAGPPPPPEPAAPPPPPQAPEQPGGGGTGGFSSSPWASPGGTVGTSGQYAGGGLADLLGAIGRRGGGANPFGG